MSGSLARAFDLVEPFTSSDDTRPHLCKPARYAGHVVATDGHTMGVARYDGEGSDPERELDQKAHHAPPWQVILPASLKCIGEVTRSDVASFVHFPQRWSTFVTMRTAVAYIDAKIPARTGRHGKILAPEIKMVIRSELDGFAQLRLDHELGADVGYFARCFSMVTLGVLPACYIHNEGPLDPIIFAPDECSTKDDLFKQDQFAIMMPVRL